MFLKKLVLNLKYLNDYSNNEFMYRNVIPKKCHTNEQKYYLDYTLIVVQIYKIVFDKPFLHNSIIVLILYNNIEFTKKVLIRENKYKFNTSCLN